MAVYYSIKCPHCNSTIESGKDRQKAYGSPVRTCPRCRRTYLDDNFTEPALLSEKEIKERAFGWGSVASAVIGGFLLVLGIAELTPFLIIAGIALAVFAVFSIVSSLKYDPNNDETFQNELQRSKQRLSDPHYVITLWEMGYGIPAEIFNEAKTTLNYKTKSEIYQEMMQSDDYDETKYLCTMFKFVSDAGEGKCLICRQNSILKKYKIKNEIGTREIPICERCIARFNKHNNF